MSDYGEAGAERLSQMRSALGRRYRDPSVPGREERTRSDILRETGTIPSDVTAPADQDMWEEEEDQGASESIEIPLPPPEYVNNIRFIPQSGKSSRRVARPDKYPEFYGAAPGASTRVAGMQWIPTSAVSGSVVGDVVCAFARPSKSNPKPFYVYENITDDQWASIQSTDSYGRHIRTLASYHVLTDLDKENYKRLHIKSNNGDPWEDWIFEKTAFLTLRILNESETWDEGKPSIREVGRESSRKSRASSKATRAQARKERKEGGSNWGNRTRSIDYNPENRNDY